jgi:hypothetical protein
MHGFDGRRGSDARPRIRRGLRVDHLGDERLVLDPAAGLVHTVRGAAVTTLDSIRAGGPGDDDEVITALVGAGIVEVAGLSRRDALLLSGSALALIASVSLPSAFAAASTVDFSATRSEGGSVIEYSLLEPIGARLFRLVNLTLAETDTTYALTIGSPTDLEVLLVGGGGAGGGFGDVDAPTYYGGGGGGGEVALVALGQVAAGTTLLVTVGGHSRSVGRATELMISGTTDAVVARGGGQGAPRTGMTRLPAGEGGSGGGGNPDLNSGGLGTSGTANGLVRTATLVSGGGTGNAGHTAAAGGGGAGGTGVDSASTAGGDGGPGVTLAEVTSWDLAVSPGSDDPTEVQNVLGSGGGGAGSGAGGTSDASSNRIAGRGGTINSDGFAIAASGGRLASGSGGGGGILFVFGEEVTSASAGRGGSGVVWVRARP